MSFNVIPKDAPASTSSQNSQPSARERAVNAFKASQAAQINGSTTDMPAEVALAQASKNISNSQEPRQPDTSEAPQATEPPKEVTEKALSPHHAALARKEKALRAQVQQFKQEQLSFKQQMEQFNAQKAEIDQKLAQLDRLDKDPWSVLNEKGVTYDQITAQALSQPSEEQKAIARLEARLKAQDEAIERQQKASEQVQTDQYQQAVNQIKFETKTLVAKDPAFEMVKATNSVNDVVELIEKTFKEDQVLLTVEEAAQMVEEYLTDEAIKLARLGKIQRKLAPATQKTPVQKQQATPAQGTPAQQSVKTLTNTLGSARQLSRKERAILAFEGKLQK